MILLIDKPENITSHGVVSAIRRPLKAFDKDVKVGHTGTLDPMCTGILPVLIGKDTKISDYLPKNKAYRAEILLGKTTDTEDITGNVLSESEVSFNIEDVKEAAKTFVGKINQIPPMYSALKINGQKLYSLARQGIEVPRTPREIEIYSIDVFPTEKKNTYILDVSCSSGTYIRTLCADIGNKLGCGGCMASLRRTVSNGFSVKNAISLDEAVNLAKDGKISEISISSEDILDVKKAILSENAENFYKNGGTIINSRAGLENDDCGIFKVYGKDLKFIGYGFSENGNIKPIITY